MHFPSFVHVLLYHIVKLVGIGCEIVQLRNTGVGTVEQGSNVPQ